MKFKFVLIISGVILTASCSNELDFPGKNIPFSYKYIIKHKNKDVGRLTLSSYFTDKTGQNQIATKAVYVFKKSYNFPTYSGRDILKSIVDFSNTCIYYETRSGEPVKATFIIKSSHKYTKNYEKVFRSRLKYEYGRHHGPNAPGTDKYVEETFKITKASEEKSFPNETINISFDKGSTSITTSSSSANTNTKSMSYDKSLSLPFLFRYKLSQFIKTTQTNTSLKLLLPGNTKLTDVKINDKENIKKKVKSAKIKKKAKKKISYNSFTISFGNLRKILIKMDLDKKIIPVNITYDEWSILRLPPKEKKK